MYLNLSTIGVLLVLHIFTLYLVLHNVFKNLDKYKKTYICNSHRNNNLAFILAIVLFSQPVINTIVYMFSMAWTFCLQLLNIGEKKK